MQREHLESEKKKLEEKKVKDDAKMEADRLKREKQIEDERIRKEKQIEVRCCSLRGKKQKKTNEKWIFTY